MASPYVVDRYTKEWLSYERKHWAPDPYEKVLDDALASSSDGTKIPAALKWLVALVVADDLDAPWLGRIVKEALDARVRLTQQATSTTCENITVEEEVICTICGDRTDRAIIYSCGHVWCGNCVAAAFEASYNSMWTAEHFPARACCSEQPLGQVVQATVLLPVEDLLKCLEKHWAWSQRGEIDLETAAAIVAATEDSQMCGKCSNVIQRKDGCNHMKCSHCAHDFCYACGADWDPDPTVYHCAQGHGSWYGLGAGGLQ